MSDCSGAAAQSKDNPAFAGPLPWIGLYAAVATIFCTILMAVDVTTAITLRQFRFPISFRFRLNAFTLFLISVAVKLPLDLNTAMPSQFDQLAKLSGLAFSSTTTANLHSSLASINSTSDLTSNLTALALTIVTVVVNVSIQIRTGVIHAFIPEHIAIMVLSVALVLVICSSALSVSTIKKLLQRESDRRADPIYLGDNNLDADSLKNYVNCWWMMAQTSDPQFVLGRSVTSTASGAFGLLTSLILLEATGRYFTHAINFNNDDSDYKWSIKVVFFCQLIAVLVGTIAPTCRWFSAIIFRGPCTSKCCFDGIEHDEQRQFTFLKDLKPESYWFEKIEKWKKNASFIFWFDNYLCLRRLVHRIKIVGLGLLKGYQAIVIVVCKVVHLASMWPVIWIYRGWRWLRTSSDTDCNGTRTTSPIQQQQEKIPQSNSCSGNLSPSSKILPNRSPLPDNISSHGSSTPCIKQPGEFVLCLDGEENDNSRNILILWNGNRTEKWFQRGLHKKRPTNLIALMDLNGNRDFSLGFQFVRSFDNGRTTSLVPEEPPNCWALPLVTLTAIAGAVHRRVGSDGSDLVGLRNGVREGLRYVRLVEKFMDEQGLVRMGEAADMLWLTVDVYGKWLSYDLSGVNEEDEISTVIKLLNDTSAQGQRDLAAWSEWPEEAYQNNCMYRVTATILEAYGGRHGELFGRIKRMISDILCACLTNIPGVIDKLCVCTTIEKRAKRVKKAAHLFGETEEIIQMLRISQQSYPDERQYIDNWLPQMKNRTYIDNPLSTSNIPSTSPSRDSTSHCLDC
ncbi:hypothetical protein Cni_G14281 [Canna indica]|uniref:Uncharacterized protein n=1 Tax=Canna indica TaxID=4628 RepID=A0AAQ3KG25_9LILI|nr:hypothetical protein Cni_G14281 [Canna indica]